MTDKYNDLVTSLEDSLKEQQGYADFARSVGYALIETYSGAKKTSDIYALPKISPDSLMEVKILENYLSDNPEIKKYFLGEFSKSRLEFAPLVYEWATLTGGISPEENSVLSNGIHTAQSIFKQGQETHGIQNYSMSDLQEELYIVFSDTYIDLSDDYYFDTCYFMEYGEFSIELTDEEAKLSRIEIAKATKSSIDCDVEATSFYAKTALLKLESEEGEPHLSPEEAMALSEITESIKNNEELSENAKQMKKVLEIISEYAKTDSDYKEHRERYEDAKAVAEAKANILKMKQKNKEKANEQSNIKPS